MLRLLSCDSPRILDCVFADDSQFVALLASNEKLVWNRFTGDITSRIFYENWPTLAISPICYAPLGEMYIVVTDLESASTYLLSLTVTPASDAWHYRQKVDFIARCLELQVIDYQWNLLALTSKGVYRIQRSGQKNPWPSDPRRSNSSWLQRKDGISKMRVAEDRRTVALAYGNEIKIGDKDAHKLPVSFFAGGNIRDLRINSSQTCLAGCWDNTVGLWDVSTQHELFDLQAHSARVNSICFRPDGRVLASGGADGLVVFWDTASGREIQRYDFGVGPVNQVAFSPDSLTLAVAGDRGLVLVDAQ